MGWWILATAISVGTVVVLAVRLRRALRLLGTGADRRVGADLAGAAARRAEVRLGLTTVAARLPDRPDLVDHELPTLPQVAAIEAYLLRGEAKKALAVAEAQVSEAPADPGAHALLARALLFADALVPAQGEIARARQLGGRDSILDYLEGRVEHLLWLRRTNPGHPEVQTQLVPPLVTPFDRLILGLMRRRIGAPAEATIWLASEGRERQVSITPEQAEALLRDHHEIGDRCLGLLLGAALAAPGSAERAYHLARRAVGHGYVAEGRAIFARLAPLMASSPERASFERDVADLAGRVDLPSDPPDPQAPPTPPGAKRSAKLVVLGK
jgi:hypothetical protein